MVETGSTAPDFTAPLANGDVEEFSLSENLSDAPIVLAFFPGAFTSVCTDEMCTFDERLSNFEELNATIYGISVDTPFSLNEFRKQNDLSFGMISDSNKDIIDKYNVRMDFDSMGYYGVAKRSIFVIDSNGKITYDWVSDDPGVEPNYQKIENSASEVAE